MNDYLYILDTDLEIVNIISSWSSFSFTKTLNSQGTFRLTINANSRNAGQINEGQILYDGYDKAGYIKKIESYKQTDSAKDNLIISGIELKDVIGSRIVYPPSGQEACSYVSQKTEYIIRDLIDKQIINPTDTNRAVDIFQLGASNNLGTNKDFSSRLQMLSKEIYKLLLDDSLGIKCVIDMEIKKAVIGIYEGLNRTADQSTNPRAVFNIKNGTLYHSSVIKDASAYKSVIYVGDDKEGTERGIVELPADNSISGLDRWETFLDARNAKTEDEIISRGNAKLAELNKTYVISGNVSLNDKLTYDLGDIVTIEDDDSYQNSQITAITTNMNTSSIEQKAVTFGAPPLSLSQAINSRLEGLNNILTV